MKIFSKADGIVDPFFGVDPEWFEAHIRPRFPLTVDSCASPDNNKLPRFWGPGGERPDGLKTAWGSECLWCAAPHEWAHLRITKAKREPRAFVVMLLDEAHRQAAEAAGGTVEYIGEVPLTTPRLYPDEVHPPVNWILWVRPPLETSNAAA